MNDQRSLSGPEADFGLDRSETAQQTVGVNTQDLPIAGTEELSNPEKKSAREIGCRQLFEAYGPLLTREQLVQLLGFRTGEAFDRSVERGQLDLKVIRIPHRQGLFCRTSDLIDYLDSLDQHVIQRKGRKTQQ
ncbi:hypothetical protein [Roseateles paludis]|uniref:DNA-binding protein n=1 Tax=Roseateles paludis TaxID=3145238 RepID=A0ABV0FVV7_9BURK